MGIDILTIDPKGVTHVNLARPAIETLWLADLLIRLCRAGEAVTLLEELTGREPDLAEAHYLLGVAYRKTYCLFDAIRSFRRAIELDPDNDRWNRALANLVEVEEP